MLPLGGRPMISYAIQEAALSGLEEIYIIINQRKDALRRYLESADLQRAMRAGKSSRDISLPRFTFIDQPIPLGTGEAIYRARELIGDDPFALMMPDFVFFGRVPALAQVIPLYERGGGDAVGLIDLSGKEAQGFGNVGIVRGHEREPGIVAVKGLSAKAPGPLILKEDEGVFKAIARWILGPHVFEYVERTKVSQGEWDDTPALQLLCAEKEVWGRVLEGRGFDVGNPVGYEAATAFVQVLDARGKR